MKKNNLLGFAFAATCLLSACDSDAPTNKSNAADVPAEEGAKVADTTVAAPKNIAGSDIVLQRNVKQTADLRGNYLGMFGTNKINIVVTEMTDKTIKGHSVVAGNDRPFEGTVALDENRYHIKAAEPGTDKYDGKFEFTISRKAGYDSIPLYGKWIPNDKKAKPKTFQLQKVAFKYNVDAGAFAQSSKRELKAADVENVSKYELTLMRNEIYARHGYCFKNKEMRTYFDGQDWYIPMNVDIRTELSPTEKKNEALLKRYEKFAVDYYDEYGR